MTPSQVITPCNGIDLTIQVRPGTKDSAVIDEVIGKRCYRHTRHKFDVEEGERWMDLGAHIGCFSLYALARGASEVFAFEPHPHNVTQYRRNLSANFSDISGQWTIRSGIVSNSELETAVLYETSSGHNTKYTSLAGAKTASTGVVSNTNFSGAVVARLPHGIKMDIEGAEHAILDNLTKLPTSVKKMVIEYHFTKDKYLANFKRRMDNLRKLFSEVHYPAHLDRMLNDGVEEFPGHFDRIIFCKR